MTFSTWQVCTYSETTCTKYVNREYVLLTRREQNTCALLFSFDGEILENSFAHEIFRGKIGEKMNVKVISRNPDEYLRDTKRGLHKMKRNYDPELHPMESARMLFAYVVLQLTRVDYQPSILMSVSQSFQVNMSEH